ncbi:phosphotransferase [Ilyonectria robusta]|uniref:phosphotransferase n=1 Tax=Ilyonectria robusta TaxID=1079257 RepID=UPI001E8E1BDE|nr:phosphotransferase [Ilyonectria robusta]KAH8722008.1 phosphotransferase [Ilyonectria robusta]
MYDGQEELDNLVWDKNDDDGDESLKQMRLKTRCRQVEDLSEQKFGKKATLMSSLIIGGFNILYRISLEGLTCDVMVRLPCPNLVQFPEEKTIQEAATAGFIAKNTQVPVPKQYFYGPDSPVGPFVILQYIQNCGSMSARLTAPNDDPNAQHGKAARCLLQLSRLKFPRIGSLVEAEDGSYNIAGRPITHNMADMVRLANIPRAVLPPKDKAYGTADEWYVALAEMHMAQLVFQHNDAISSEDDCRNKYVARQIFRMLAKQGRLSTFGFAEDDWSAQSAKLASSTLSPAPSGSDSFRLWGDDLRAGNILLTDSDDIAALIDWEFSYAAPTQFALDPPWWLLLDLAETWASGIDDWKHIYEMRLETWLFAMKRVEAEENIQDFHSLPVPLSTYMRESWETSRFWLSYGARKSWAFDTMYWRYLDEKFFGDRESDIPQEALWKTRIHLLSDDERRAMEPFVETKLIESKERIIVDWEPEKARERLSELLFD